MDAPIQKESVSGRFTTLNDINKQNFLYASQEDVSALIFFSADVTAFLTKYCSGKRECHIPNIEAFLEAYHTCPKDLKSYILASYECVTGGWFFNTFLWHVFVMILFVLNPSSCSFPIVGLNVSLVHGCKLAYIFICTDNKNMKSISIMTHFLSGHTVLLPTLVLPHFGTEVKSQTKQKMEKKKKKSDVCFISLRNSCQKTRVSFQVSNLLSFGCREKTSVSET